MNFSYFLELVWFQSLTALAFGDPEACILVFSFSSFHLPPLGALPPPSCPARSVSPCRRTPRSPSHEQPSHTAQSIPAQQRCLPHPPHFLPPAPAGWGARIPILPSRPSREMNDCQSLSGRAGSCLTIRLFMMSFSLELSFFNEGLFFFVVKTTIEVMGKG